MAQDDEEDESEESGSDEESDDEAESGDSKAGDSGSESSHSTAAGPAVDEAQVLGVITWRSVELGSPSLAGFFQDLLALDVGAASLPPSQRSKVMHIQFVGVLSAARRGRIGTRLIEAVLAHARLECCCAVVVHSEPSAVPFFSRAGFTDEPRLNIRYKSLTSVLARSTLMSFSLLGTTSPLVPAASPGHVHGDFTSDVALLTQRFLASQATAMADSLWLIQALRTEVEMLRGQLASKADETSTLKMQINRLTQQNAQLQRIVTLSSSTAVSEPRGDTDPSSPLLSVPNGSTEFVSVAASVEVSALSSSRDATVTHVWKPMESDATLAFAAAVRRITAECVESQTLGGLVNTSPMELYCRCSWTTALTIAANGFTADTRPALSPGSGWVLSRRLEMNRPTVGYFFPA